MGKHTFYRGGRNIAHAEERRRNASRAATLGNSKIDAELRGVRLMTKELVEQTVSGELDLRVKKRLTEIAQLLQTYCRLAELELAAGGRPRFSEPGEYDLPEDTAEKAREWVEKEGEKEGLLAGLGPVHPKEAYSPECVEGTFSEIRNG